MDSAIFYRFLFYLDPHLLFQFNGKDANKDEKYKATQYVQMLKSERKGKATVEVLDELETKNTHPVFALLKEGSSKKVTYL